MFNIPTHFTLTELEIEKGYITGSAKNFGSYNVGSVNIVVTLKEKDGGYRTINIPLDPQDLEVGEETTFRKEIDNYSKKDFRDLVKNVRVDMGANDYLFKNSFE